MFNLFGKKSNPPAPLSLRDALFGDAPLDLWPGPNPSAPQAEPWKSFIQAREALNKKKPQEAIQIWQRITDMPNLESRHYLQAWLFLRGQGIQPPPEKAKLVYGVVVEVDMEKGTDFVAAYPDGHARYWNYTGAGVVWEKPNDSLDPLIKDVIQAGQQIALKIGIWNKERPDVPGKGEVRLNVLTPGGLRFGQGSFDVLSADPMARPLIDAATALMLEMTKLGKAAPKK